MTSKGVQIDNSIKICLDRRNGLKIASTNNRVNKAPHDRCMRCSKFLKCIVNLPVCPRCRDSFYAKNNRPLPPTPTKFLPGTEEKIKVLQQRAFKGYSLWHPLDASYESQVSKVSK